MFLTFGLVTFGSRAAVTKNVNSSDLDIDEMNAILRSHFIEIGESQSESAAALKKFDELAKHQDPRPKLLYFASHCASWLRRKSDEVAKYCPPDKRLPQRPDLSAEDTPDDALDQYSAELTRIRLAEFPVPERFLFEILNFVPFSCKHALGFSGASERLQGLMLEWARRVLNAGGLTDGEVTVRIGRWYIAEGFDDKIPFDECPSKALAFLLSLYSNGAECVKIDRRVYVDIPIVIVSAVESTFSKETMRRSHGKTSLKWYLRVRLEPEADWLQQVPDDVLPAILELAEMIELSTASKYPIDSSEFRSSALFAIPADTIRALADRAQLGLIDARRLPLVDLIFAARSVKKRSLFMPEHSEHYDSVSWNGTAYTFGAKQAAVVKVLWKAWEAGKPSVLDVDLIDAAGSEGSRVRDIFRLGGVTNPAWNTMIVKVGRNHYKLSSPKTPEPQ